MSPICFCFCFSLREWKGSGCERLHSPATTVEGMICYVPSSVIFIFICFFFPFKYLNEENKWYFRSKEKVNFAESKRQPRWLDKEPECFHTIWVQGISEITRFSEEQLSPGMNFVRLWITCYKATFLFCESLVCAKSFVGLYLKRRDKQISSKNFLRIFFFFSVWNSTN